MDFPKTTEQGGPKAARSPHRELVSVKEIKHEMKAHHFDYCPMHRFRSRRRERAGGKWATQSTDPILGPRFVFLSAFLLLHLLRCGALPAQN